MERKILIGGGIIFAAILGLVIVNFIQSPVEARRAQLEQQLDAIDSDWELEEARQSEPPATLASQVVNNDHVWKSLVPPPPKPKPKFNMDAAVKGIEPTGFTQIRDGRMLARIKTPAHPRGKYYGEGDVILPSNGMIVKKVAENGIALSIEVNGEEHVKLMPR